MRCRREKDERLRRDGGGCLGIDADYVILPADFTLPRTCSI